MDFVSVLEKELGVIAEKIQKPMQEGDMKETYASISKAQRELGFKPKVLIVEGVGKFGTWYRSYTAK